MADRTAELEAMNAQQSDTIKRLWHELSVIKRRDEHAQAYIEKLKAQRDELRAQLTPEARAGWIIGVTGND